MAFTPTSRRLTGFARRALTAGAAFAVAGAATLVFAAPASAHDSTVQAGCTEKGTFLKVNLRNYDIEGGENLVFIAADNDEKPLVDIVLEESNYSFVKEDFDNTVDHEFFVAVDAHDDPVKDDEEGYSFEKLLVVEACAEAPEPTTTTEEAAPTTTEAPPAGGDSGLADTGASIVIPLVLGLLLLGGGGTLLLLMRRRGQHSA